MDDSPGQFDQPLTAAEAGAGIGRTAARAKPFQRGCDAGAGAAGVNFHAGGQLGVMFVIGDGGLDVVEANLPVIETFVGARPACRD